MSHIIGAIYTSNQQGRSFVCRGANCYVWINGMFKNSNLGDQLKIYHEDLISRNWVCEYPKESNFDSLYLRLKQ